MKKFILCLLCAVLLLSVATPALACPGEEGFTCWILETEMPAGAVYVDLLLPLKSTDEGYTAYNQQNGQKYGLAEDSPIVQYSQDGYQSYAFHVQNACPTLAPLQICKVTMPRELFIDEIRKETLFTFENYAYQTSADEDPAEKELIVADSRYPYQSGKKAEIDAFALRHGLTPNYDPYLYLNYCLAGPDATPEQVTALTKKWGYAKLAYLDAKGNILAVTDVGKMHHKGLFVNKKTVFTAYGLHIDEELSYKMAPFSFGFIGVVFTLLVLAFGVFFVKGALKIIRQKKQEK